MSYFTTYKKAQAYAEYFGYNYSYEIKKTPNKRYYVVWDFKEPNNV